MDIFGSIFLLVVLSAVFLGTLNSLYEGGYFIFREWWDDDYRRLGKTTFKSRVKGILIALLINIIIFSLFYILGPNDPLTWLLSLAFIFFCVSK